MRVVAAGWIPVALVACAACEAPQADGNGEARATRAEAWPAAKPADVESVDAILSALYSAISFAPGGEPDWMRLRSLFHPAGTLAPPRGEGSRALVLTVEEFVRASSEYIAASGLDARGFSERELGRRLERFGDVAHAFSAYASRYAADDPEPYSRGVNSIQLVRGEGRWWVLHIAWDVERPGNPIPPELEAR